jgi:hypothetical protein
MGTNTVSLRLSRAHSDDNPLSSASLRSGPGAPIFESLPGQETRIRRNPSRAFAIIRRAGGPHRVFGQVNNVSLTGCLLCTESTLPEGSELGLEITVVGGSFSESLRVTGIVRRETREAGRRAYGVEFVAHTSRDREILQALYAETA